MICSFFQDERDRMESRQRDEKDKLLKENEELLKISC